MRPIPFLFALALLGSSLAITATEPEKTESASPETSDKSAPAPPFMAGEEFPLEGLPTKWLRGATIASMDPGIAYVVTRWDTRGRRVAPGHNIIRPITEVGPHPRLQGLVLFAGDDISTERLERRLSYPSQQNDLPLADARSTDNPTSRLWLSRMATPDINTVVVRNARVVWAGNGFDLEAEALRPFLVDDFDYKKYVAQKAQSDALAKKQLNLIVKEYPAAARAGEKERVDAILAELQATENLHPFIGMRLHDALFQRALEADDIPGALATMQAMVGAYPESKEVYSWAHKVINSSEPVLQPGQAQAGRAAAKVAELRNDHVSIHWWRAAAEHFLKAGDKKAALEALEAAEKSSDTYKKLQTYRGVKKSD